MRLHTILGGSLGTNCYVVEKDNHVILFDFVPEVEKHIIKHNWIVDKIFLTHIHFDHFEGLFLFQDKYDFQLVLSEKSHQNINKKEYNLLNMFGDQISNYIGAIDLDKVVMVNDQDQVDWQNTMVTVYETPGHSPDSVVYTIADSKYLFSGDTIFQLSVGRADFPGSSHEQMIDSIKRLFQLLGDINYKIYPGHGPSTTLDFEKKNNPFILSR
ncbi:MAG: MBL fold metallo-hydrolase [Spirochaetes bacterium]|nr:MBL fold metallo-hydrolase [Spirochaetota bacterium]